jgi:hypothetical protein
MIVTIKYRLEVSATAAMIPTGMIPTGRSIRKAMTWWV